MGMDETRGIADFTVKKTLPKKHPRKVFARLLQKAAGSRGRAPDVPCRTGNSEQGLAPRSKPAAARAARSCLEHRKRRWG